VDIDVADIEVDANLRTNAVSGQPRVERLRYGQRDSCQFSPSSRKPARGKSAMRLGIFGGTFDPVHYGHLLLAECCREQLDLEQVWFLPAAVPPHKRGRELTPGEKRAEMLELAIAGHPAFSVCRFEIERGGVNYTVDTLAHLHAEHPHADLFFLMGADSLADLPTWKDPAGICRLADLVVVDRGGADREVAADQLSKLRRLTPLAPPEQLPTVRSHSVHMPRIELSASGIRECVAQSKSIRYRTPRAVEKYIQTHGLYRETG
jgi:nicotinate-nucleotide adenylyltransferase